MRQSLTLPFHPYHFHGGNISVALSVKTGLYKNLCSYQVLPGCYPAFFPKEPGLYLIIRSYHQDITTRLYPICTKIIQRLLRQILHLKDHHHFHHPMNPDLLHHILRCFRFQNLRPFLLLHHQNHQDQQDFLLLSK